MKNHSTSPARRRIVGVATVAVMVAAGIFGASGAAHAASPVIEVLPSTLTATGWDQVYSGGTGAYSFVDAPDAPLGTGALLMSTPLNADYVQLGRTLTAAVPLANADFSYASKRLSGVAHAAPGLVLTINLGPEFDPSAASSWMWAWYEPDYNGGTDYDNWNTWSVTSSSNFWFNGAHTGPDFSGAFTATFGQVLAIYPNAEIQELYLNMGSGNAGWSALVDAVDDMTSTSNFERVAAPITVPPGEVGPELAATGSDSAPMFFGGVVLIAFGAVLIGFMTRRRKAL